jgi:hypothetical protein
MEIKNAGQAPDGSFKMSQYNAAAMAINDDAQARNATPTIPIEGSQCKTRLEALKRMWRTWNDHLRAVSGWGCRDDGLPQASISVMDDYFKKNPKRKQFRHHLPVCHGQLKELIDGQMATGAYATDINAVLLESQNAELNTISDPEEDSESVRFSMEGSPVSVSSSSPSERMQSTFPVNLRRRALSHATETASKKRSKMSGTEKIAEAIEASGSRLGDSIQAMTDAIDMEQQRIDVVMDILEREFAHLTVNAQLALAMELENPIKRSMFVRYNASKRIRMAKGLLGSVWQEEEDREISDVEVSGGGDDDSS